MLLECHKPLKVALDCDDVLVPCTSLALERVQKKYNFDPPLDIKEVTTWEPNGSRVDCFRECFKEHSDVGGVDFYESQVPYPGAQEFVSKLSKIADIYIITAVPMHALTARAKTLITYFPEIKSENIIMTTSKSVIDVDIVLDDGPHNFFAVTAKYPVLFRRPWNANITGVLAVNGYDEFLTLVNTIKNRSNDKALSPDKPCILALVGVSGSGKTTLAQELEKISNFKQPWSYTNRPKRDENDCHLFVSDEEFESLKNSGDIFEYTTYAGYFYGSSTSVIEGILNEGCNVVLPVDISGAMCLKTKFDNVATVYVDRPKKDLLASLLERNCSTEDKINRIISMDKEVQNIEICDYVIKNVGLVSDVANELLSITKN